MNLARRFNAGISALWSRRVATIESGSSFRRRYATRTLRSLFPALKGRAKFMPTLRVASTCSELLKFEV